MTKFFAMTKGTVGLMIIAFLVLESCQPEDNMPIGGSVDLDNYISVGNSLTAGYTNNGLYREGQINSYPNILAQQFSLVTEIDFKQPLMPEGNGSGYLKLISYTTGSFPQIEVMAQDPRAYDKINGPFNNLGVPGLRVKDVSLAEYGLRDLNRFFYKMIPSGNENSTSYLDVVSESNPTFFTCWLGNNDILGYALEGGFYGPDGHGPYGNGGLTDSTIFKNNYDRLITSLMNTDAKGILLTIPDISFIPYFNIVSNDLFPNLSVQKVEELNLLWSDYNKLIEKHNEEVENDGSLKEEEKTMLKREKIEFYSDGQNRFIIEDNHMPDLVIDEAAPKIRHIRDGEVITLAGGQKIINLNYPAGIETMLEDRYVLTQKELNLMKDHLNSYNSSIQSIANQYGLTVVNTNDLLQEFVGGKEVDGLSLSTEYIEGGLFSLDAIHLTPRGNAVIANAVIRSVNNNFGASIPTVSLLQYNGVLTDE